MAHIGDYEWVSAKFNGELKVDNEAFSFSGTLRMRRDSTVWISASVFMGMESLRLLATQDSVVMINRMNQTYLAEPITAVIKTVPAPSLREIQTLLLGDGTTDHVEIPWGSFLTKIRYSDIQWNEPTTFPIKINKNYERIKP